MQWVFNFLHLFAVVLSVFRFAENAIVSYFPTCAWLKVCLPCNQLEVVYGIHRHSLMFIFVFSCLDLVSTVFTGQASLEIQWPAPVWGRRQCRSSKCWCNRLLRILHILCKQTNRNGSSNISPFSVLARIFLPTDIIHVKKKTRKQERRRPAKCFIRVTISRSLNMDV